MFFPYKFKILILTEFRGLFWRQNKMSQIKSKEPSSESVIQSELNKR